MDQFIRYGFSAEAIPLYNCSLRENTNDELSTGTIHSGIGYGSLSYGIVTELSYLLVLKAMLSKEIIKWSCYKIMFILGIYDMIDIAINSIITGVFFLNGVVFCDYPDLIYIVGKSATGAWCGSCLTCLLLVINRLLDLWKPSLNQKLFEGSRIFYWFIAPFTYTIYFLLFTPPVLFNSHMMAWFFDPFIRAEDSGKFPNIPNYINNVFVVAFTCTMYIVLCFILHKKVKKAGPQAQSKISKKQKSIIIQSFLICSANLVASLIYMYMQVFPTPQSLIFIAQLTWMMGPGLPVYVYLTLNKTIKREVLRMFGLQVQNAKTFVMTHSAYGGSVQS